MAIEFNSAVTLVMVFDMPTSVAFYRDMVGFEVVNTSQAFNGGKDNYGWALLRHDGIELMLNNMYEDNRRPAQPDALRTKHHGDTILYLTGPDVDRTYAYLQSKGVAVSPPVDAYYGMRQVHVLDPDGYTLVFQTPILEAPVSETAVSETAAEEK